MNTRENILAAVLGNQPASTALPDISGFTMDFEDTVSAYIATFTGIGGMAGIIPDTSGVEPFVKEHFATTGRIVTTLPGLMGLAELYDAGADPHSFDDVELAIVSAVFAVAENGAVWLTEREMGHRILPIICQHLLVLVAAETIVPTMHEAYEKIGEDEYGFGLFIGGPSKTADIEQALVMGAHGPISMGVLVIQPK